jgi:septum formation protein
MPSGTKKEYPQVSPMPPLILASSSSIRAQLLRNAGLIPEIKPARVDEETIRRSLKADNTQPRDIADALADAKARKIAQRNPDTLVLGCDQVAAFQSEILTKPTTQDQAVSQLTLLSGQTHKLHSAAVLYHDARPIWRQIGTVSLTMHALSPDFIKAYAARNWPSISHAVGGYKLEEEGVRLFSAIQGDYFHVLGLPLIELLSYLTQRGDLEI